MLLFGYEVIRVMFSVIFIGGLKIKINFRVIRGSKINWDFKFIKVVLGCFNKVLKWFILRFSVILNIKNVKYKLRKLSCFGLKFIWILFKVFICLD